MPTPTSRSASRRGARRTCHPAALTPPYLRSQYIPGHNPDLVLFDAEDVEVERIDLTAYKTAEALRNLVGSKGFGPKAACEDESSECKAWADAGQCTANPDYMTKSCKQSCG